MNVPGPKADRFQFRWSEEPRFPDLCAFCGRDRPDDFAKVRFARPLNEFDQNAIEPWALWVPCCKRCQWFYWLRFELPKWLAIGFGGVLCVMGFVLGMQISGPLDAVGVSIVIGCALVGLAIGISVALVLTRPFPPPLAIRGYLDLFEVEIVGRAYSAAFAEANGREKFNPMN